MGFDSLRLDKLGQSLDRPEALLAQLTDPLQYLRLMFGPLRNCLAVLLLALNEKIELGLDSVGRQLL